MTLDAEEVSDNRSEVEAPREPRKPAAADDAKDVDGKHVETTSGLSWGCGKWLLALAGVFMACATTIVDLAMQGLVSRRDGAVMLAALSATRASMGWATGMFGFVFTGAVSIIGTAAGEGDDLRAGRYARLSMAIAIVAGLLGTAVLVTCTEHVLCLFGQEEVAKLASGVFRLKAAAFTIAVLGMALNGIMLGFMYVHLAFLFITIGSVVSLGLFYPLYLMTDLGLKAFAISMTVGAVTSVALTLTFLFQGHRRRRFGLDLGFSDIGLAELRGLGSSLGCLAFRSFVSDTPYMLSVLMSIRLSPVHGAVFQLLISKSNIADLTTGGFALGINFIGSRLWGGRYHGAFWNLLIVFIGWIATPLAVILCTLEMFRGRDSLGETFAKVGEKAYFDAVMTRSAFAFYILFLAGRAYYKMVEQALIAMQEYWRLAVIQGVAFIAYLCVSISGYMMKDFDVLLLGSLVFIFCRISGGAWVLCRKLRTHPFERYRRGTTSDPDHALKLTIDDPAVAKVFGGRATPRLKEQEENELASV